MGWKFGFINRVPISIPTIDSGHVPASGYAVENLIDPTPWAQCILTPGGTAVRLRFRLPGASALADTDFACDSLGFVNSNLDGLTIELRGYNGATPSWASASVLLAPFQLENYVANTPFLKGFSSGAYEYLYVQISAGTSPAVPMPALLKIGAVFIGPTWDLGYPMRPESFSFSPPPGSRLISPSGYALNGSIDQPLRQKQLIFRNPSSSTLAPHLITGRAKNALGGNYLAFNSLLLAFENEYQMSLASGAAFRTGFCVGGGCPVIYNMGSANNSLSAAGRPSFYGLISGSIDANYARLQSSISLSIIDLLPASMGIQPAGN